MGWLIYAGGTMKKRGSFGWGLVAGIVIALVACGIAAILILNQFAHGMMQAF